MTQGQKPIREILGSYARICVEARTEGLEDIPHIFSTKQTRINKQTSARVHINMKEINSRYKACHIPIICPSLLDLLVLGILLSYNRSSLLALGLGLLGLNRQAREEPANASLVLAVLRVLASTNLFGQTCAALENSKVAKDTKSGPLEVVTGADSAPEVHGQPNSLLGDKVGVARPRPESADDETTLQVLRGVLVLEGLRDARIGEVFVLGSLEVPLLLVGEEGDGNKEDGGAGEGEVGKTEGLTCLIVGRDEEYVSWGGDEQKKQRLGQGDESEVENGKKEGVVNLRAHDLPAVILRANRVATFAPIVVGQTSLMMICY